MGNAKVVEIKRVSTKIAPLGKEATGEELQDHAAKAQETFVDAVESAEVAEIKRRLMVKMRFMSCPPTLEPRQLIQQRQVASIVMDTGHTRKNGRSQSRCIP